MGKEWKQKEEITSGKSLMKVIMSSCRAGLGTTWAVGKTKVWGAHAPFIEPVHRLFVQNVCDHTTLQELG